MDTADTTARMTVTLPADLYAEVQARLSENGTGNRSRFVADALRTHLRQLRLHDLTLEAAKLDLDEELAWTAPHQTDPAPEAPA